MHELLGHGLERGGNIPGVQQAVCLREGYTLLARQQARRAWAGSPAPGVCRKTSRPRMSVTGLGYITPFL